MFLFLFCFFKRVFRGHLALHIFQSYVGSQRPQEEVSRDAAWKHPGETSGSAVEASTADGTS